MSQAFAADFPNKNIDLVVPFDPGGGVDTTSRIIIETANKLLDGVEFNVVNRSGGGGVVGQTFVSKAAADGYTILAMTSSVVTNPQLKGASYSVNDFIPVGIYNLDPEVIVVPVNSPFTTISEFMAAASNKKLNIVVAGIGTSHHMSGLAIERNTSAKFNYLPTKGFGAQLQAVLGGHVDGALWPMGEAANQATSGAVRILAVAADARESAFPDVPTFDEAGLGIPIWATFRGWSVPKGTSDEAVAFLADILGKVNADETYKKKMLAAGYKPIYRDAAGFSAVVNAYAEQTSVIIDENGLGK
ncbi:MAG: hypothetical protein COC08_06900 [Maribacter sp.]|nr:MAG: hypothetical protein COC08_06900 [Maribacter sp.]